MLFILKFNRVLKNTPITEMSTYISEIFPLKIYIKIDSWLLILVNIRRKRWQQLFFQVFIAFSRFLFKSSVCT